MKPLTKEEQLESMGKVSKAYNKMRMRDEEDAEAITELEKEKCIFYLFSNLMSKRFLCFFLSRSQLI